MSSPVPRASTMRVPRKQLPILSLAIIVIILVILSNISLSRTGTATAAATSPLILNGNFESFTGGLPDSWEYVQGQGPAILKSSLQSPFTNVYPAGSSSVLLTDGISGDFNGFTPWLLQRFTPQTGPIEFSFDFRLESLDGEVWHIALEDDIGSVIVFEIGVRREDRPNDACRTSGLPRGDYELYIFSGRPQQCHDTYVGPLTAQLWYHVRLTADPLSSTFSGSVTPFEQGSMFFNAPLGHGGAFFVVEVSDSNDHGINSGLNVDNVSVTTPIPTPTPTCSVAPITPITDPEAQNFEAHNGNIVDTTHLTTTMQAALSAFTMAVTNAQGELRLESAWRPSAYQLHLREVWDKWQLLRNQGRSECEALRTQVQSEINRHRLANLRTRPAGANGYHAKGLAIDVDFNASTLPVQTLIDLARQSGLYRRLPAKDPVHFELTPFSPLANGSAEKANGTTEGSALNIIALPITVKVNQQTLNGQVLYNYRVINNSQKSVVALKIGFDTATDLSELLFPPTGWDYFNGLPQNSVVSPTGWNPILFTTEESEFVTLDWQISDPTRSIMPGQTLGGFTAVLPQADNLYFTSHWTVVFDDGTATSASLELEGIPPANAPILLIEQDSSRAITLDAVTWLRDPFTVVTTSNFSGDQRSRIVLFAINADLLGSETASAVTAQAEDTQFKTYPLLVEYIGKVPNASWLSQVVVRLPDEIKNVGDILVSIKLHGVTSNKVLISIRPSP